MAKSAPEDLGVVGLHRWKLENDKDYRESALGINPEKSNVSTGKVNESALPLKIGK